MPIKVERFDSCGVERVGITIDHLKTLTDQESRDLIKALQEVTPLYEHDCDKCKYLGHYIADLYYCDQNGRPTVIARYSSDPPDYASGMPSEAMEKQDPRFPTVEAKRRAIAKGYIK